MKKLIIGLLLLGAVSCSTGSKQSNNTPTTTNSNSIDKLQGVGYALILPAAMVGIMIGLLI